MQREPFFGLRDHFLGGTKLIGLRKHFLCPAFMGGLSPVPYRLIAPARHVKMVKTLVSS